MGNSSSDSSVDTATSDFVAEDFAATPLDEVPIGETVRHTIRKVDGGAVLLEPEEVLTAEWVESLRRDGTDVVLVHLADRAAWQSAAGRGGPIAIDSLEVDAAPDSIRMFVERLTKLGTPVVEFERRKHPRYRIVKPIVVVPVNENNEPVGRAFEAISRDLSTGGISFIHTRAAKASRMVVELTGAQGDRKQLAIQILRCRPWNHFYEIAGAWAAKLQ
jgi:hypothetical protein